uniref:Uncharacterized protein n=1 Tax=Oxyrrhis marina TaxID=2969 RepID=A0A7S4LQG6_OXYMA
MRHLCVAAAPFAAKVLSLPDMFSLQGDSMVVSAVQSLNATTARVHVDTWWRDGVICAATCPHGAVRTAQVDCDRHCTIEIPGLNPGESYEIWCQSSSTSGVLKHYQTTVRWIQSHYKLVADMVLLFGIASSVIFMYLKLPKSDDVVPSLPSWYTGLVAVAGVVEAVCRFEVTQIHSESAWLVAFIVSCVVPPLSNASLLSGLHLPLGHRRWLAAAAVGLALGSPLVPILAVRSAARPVRFAAFFAALGVLSLGIQAFFFASAGTTVGKIGFGAVCVHVLLALEACWINLLEPAPNAQPESELQSFSSAAICCAIASPSRWMKWSPNKHV